MGPHGLTSVVPLTTPSGRTPRNKEGQFPPAYGGLPARPTKRSKRTSRQIADFPPKVRNVRNEI